MSKVSGFTPAPRPVAAPQTQKPQPPAPQPQAPRPQDTFSAPRSRALVDLSGGAPPPAVMVPEGARTPTTSTTVPTRATALSTSSTPMSSGAPATTLLSENRTDGSVNCLDAAGDYVNALPPEQQSQAQVILLQDQRSGVEGATGHVVVQVGEQIHDPSTGRTYGSMQEYLAQNSHYAPAATLSGNALLSILSTPPGSAARQNAVAAAGIPPTVANMRLADVDARQSVRNATSAYQSALAERQRVDQQLAADLAELGPYLSETERNAYIERFRQTEPMASAYNNERIAARNLSSVLQQHGSELQMIAMNELQDPTPDMGDVMVTLEAYQLLAQSPYPDAAIQFASQVLGNPDNGFALALQDAHLNPGMGFNIERDILAPALEQAVPSFLRDNPNGDPVAHLEQLLGPLATAHQTGSALSDLATPDTAKIIHDSLQGLRDYMRTGDTRGLATVLSESSSSTNRIAASFAVAGLAINVLQFGQAIEDGDPLNAAIQATLAGQNGVTIANRLATVLNRTASAAEAGSMFLTRLAGGLGALASVMDIFAQVNDPNGVDAGTAVSIAGDLISIAGYAAIASGSTGVGAPLAAAGALVVVAGELISAGIDAYNAWQTENETNTRQNSILDAMVQAGELTSGQAATIRQGITSTEHQQTMASLRASGLSAEQARTLLLECPYLQGQSLTGLSQFAQAAGMTPDEVMQFCRDLALTGMESNPDNARRISGARQWVFDALAAGATNPNQIPGSGLSNPPTNAREWMTLIQHYMGAARYQAGPNPNVEGLQLLMRYLQ